MFHNRRGKEKGTASTGARQERVFHRRGGARSARMARAIHGRRAHEAREEEWKEQEKKRYGEDDDGWVPVVPNMWAGGSYLQTLTQETRLRRS